MADRPKIEPNANTAGRAQGSAPFRVSDLRGFLTGTWTVERRVFDRRFGMEGFFSGTIRFDPIGTDLRAVEAGRMHYGDVQTDAERILLYSFPERDRARVLFADGRFFHELTLTTGRARVRHLCDRDDYIGGFWVPDGGVLFVRWRVSGPRKNLVLVSRMEKIA